MYINDENNYFLKMAKEEPVEFTRFWGVFLICMATACIIASFGLKFMEGESVVFSANNVIRHIRNLSLEHAFFILSSSAICLLTDQFMKRQIPIIYRLLLRTAGFYALTSGLLMLGDFFVRPGALFAGGFLLFHFATSVVLASRIEDIKSKSQSMLTTEKQLKLEIIVDNTKI